MIKKRGTILIILAIVAVLAAAAVYVRFRPFSMPNILPKPLPTLTPQPTPTSGQARTFQSKIMKFSIKVPSDYQVNEKPGSVTIITNNEEIDILQNSTNIDNLKDYIKYSRNNLESRITSREDFKINDLETVSGLIENEKIYFVYASYTVYVISTKASSLYDDLDQIVQTFRYTP